jgi:geranylgeranyl diphosphate synthase, type II
MMDIRKYLQEKKEAVDSALHRYFLSRVDYPPSLLKAVQYSLFAGGKRIRPILAMAASDAAGGGREGLLPFACALEMIHTYSLIHDDLPAIDNDDYRRGMPSCHKMFGEAMAILAGDALLTEAFHVLTNPVFRKDSVESGRVLLDLVYEMARAAGISGMVGGQVVDVESAGKEVDLPTLQYIHTHKTGAMILVSVRGGARLGGAEEESLKAFTRYGEKIGLAFQIVDDVLDIEGKAEVLGKPTGSDLSKGKITYPSLMGLAESKKRAEELIDSAIEALSLFGPEADPLREIARFIHSREH